MPQPAPAPVVYALDVTSIMDFLKRLIQSPAVLTALVGIIASLIGKFIPGVDTELIKSFVKIIFEVLVPASIPLEMFALKGRKMYLDGQKVRMGWTEDARGKLVAPEPKEVAA